MCMYVCLYVNLYLVLSIYFSIFHLTDTSFTYSLPVLLIVFLSNDYQVFPFHHFATVQPRLVITQFSLQYLFIAFSLLLVCFMFPWLIWGSFSSFVLVKCLPFLVFPCVFVLAVLSCCGLTFTYLGKSVGVLLEGLRWLVTEFEFLLIEGKLLLCWDI